MMEQVISVKPEELSCLVGNLFAELKPPCDIPYAAGLTLCGCTPAGREAVLVVIRDYCIFRGDPEDLEAARRPCLDRRCRCHA